MTSTTRAPERPVESGYDHAAVETKWQERWARAGCFKSGARTEGEKFFNFDGGPFPNGALHMGHVRTFTLGDAMARFQRMRGKRVLYCFEFDAFGLPNELAAEARGVTPEAFTRDNIARMRAQMIRLGFSYDWDHVVTTCDPKYYRWTQWLFLKLRAEGLVYRAAADLNWCPSCHTTLAHMQVEGGRCWRCDAAVEQRRFTQWYVALSQRSDVLARGLDGRTEFSARAQNVLQGFVAATRGVEIDFELSGYSDGSVAVFLKEELRDAAPAYLAIAPGHPVLDSMASRVDCSVTLDEWRQTNLRVRRRSEGNAQSPLDGVNTGIVAIHRASGLRLPVFVARYVDRHFATGIELGVPKQVPRDLEFAQRHGVALPGDDCAPAPRGRHATHYRVHDWLVSRQRSWGTPIPIIHCERCGEVDVPEEQLPVRLPTHHRPGRSGGLAAVSGFIETSCPACGDPARRETDTLDCYFDVIWCFLACANGLADDFAFRASDFTEWMPVDWFHNGLDSFFYVHLYRFLGQILHEAGILPDPEPIRRYVGHDAVLLGGRKMSKHHGNVVAPDEIIARAGADALRVQALWAANPLKSFEWSQSGSQRAQRLLDDIWRLVQSHAGLARKAAGGRSPAPQRPAPLARSTAYAVRRVTGFLERYQFGGCLQEIQNFAGRLCEGEGSIFAERSDPAFEQAFAEGLRTLVLLLVPFAPHIAEEMWERIGGDGFASIAHWPDSDG